MAGVMTGREFHWKANDRDIHLRIEESSGHGSLHLEDETIPFAVSNREQNGGFLEIGGRKFRFYVHRNRDEVAIWIGGRTYRLTRVQKGKSPEQTSAASGEVRSLMPGKILRIDVVSGATVTERQTVVVMESMKMETSLAAPKAGTVTAVRCQVGQVVEMGELLVLIE
jgi:acetyl/propionyl-CoA carboxylase alpha subunit